MSDSSRRGFLKAAGTGAAAAGVISVVPAVATRHGRSEPDAKKGVQLPDGAGGPLIAYVQDVHTGEVSVMVEGHEVSVTDHDLVAKLAHALHDNPPASA